MITIIVIICILAIIFFIVSSIFAVKLSKEGRPAGLVLAFLNPLFILFIYCLLVYIDAKSKKKINEEIDLEKKSLEEKIAALKTEIEEVKKQK